MTNDLDAMDLQTMRKKLIYRASHRGTRELDLMIGGFAAAHVGIYSMAQCIALDELLQLPETDLAAWLLRQKPVPPEHASQMMSDLLAFSPLSSA